MTFLSNKTARIAEITAVIVAKISSSFGGGGGIRLTTVPIRFIFLVI